MTFPGFFTQGTGVHREKLMSFELALRGVWTSVISAAVFIL